jgi:cytochrome P450
MTDSYADTLPEIAAAAAAAGCPFHGGVTTLPGDGTPLRPSPSIARWRAEAPATPLDYADGHRGLIATGYDLARAVLEDPRFSMVPGRLPLPPGGRRAHGMVGNEHDVASDPHGEHEDVDAVADPDLDAAAQRSLRAGLLGLDGDAHARLRRTVTSRFSVKQARMRQPQVAATVAATLAAFQAEGSPNDVWTRYAKPIAAITHCQVLGVPERDHERWVRLFVDNATTQQRFDFIRELLDTRAADPGEDVVTDLLASDVVTREEAEGLLFMLMVSGRDSVAYLIATATVALLTHPEQLDLLRDEPERIGPAIEEFMRTGAMFLTLFPRTALEDVELAGIRIPAGTTVSPSSVGGNRDPERWDRPEDFDVQRDAFGHLGFGHGIHGCIGQQLARVEIREAVTALISGLPGLRLEHADQLEPLPFASPVATYEAGSVIVSWRE